MKFSREPIGKRALKLPGNDAWHGEYGGIGEYFSQQITLLGGMKPELLEKMTKTSEV